MTVRTSLAMTIFALAFAVPAHHVSAQNNPIGEIVGGAVGTAGAVVEGAGRVTAGTINAAQGLHLVRSWSHAPAASIGMTVIVIAAAMTAAITPLRQTVAGNVGRLPAD